MWRRKSPEESPSSSRRKWVPLYAISVPVRVCDVLVQFPDESPKEYERRCRAELVRAHRQLADFLAKRRVRLDDRALNWKDGWIYLPTDLLLELALERVVIGNEVSVKTKESEKICAVCRRSFVIEEPYMRIPPRRTVHIRCATKWDKSFQS